jgi:hypothetical protein
MSKKYRPLIFDKKGIAVLSNDGAEQARYNPHEKNPGERAQRAAEQAVIRGDIPMTRYIAFMTALETNYGVEPPSKERKIRESAIKHYSDKFKK